MSPSPNSLPPLLRIRHFCTHTHTPHLSVLAHVCLRQLEGERWDGGLAAVGAEPSHIRQLHKRSRVLCTRCSKHGTRSQRQPRCWLQSTSSHSCSFSLQLPTHTHTTISSLLVVCEHTLLPVEAWRVDAVCVVLHVDEEVHLLGRMQQTHHKRRARTARLKRQRQSREVGHIRLIEGAGWKGEMRSKGEGVFLCSCVSAELVWFLSHTPNAPGVFEWGCQALGSACVSRTKRSLLVRIAAAKGSWAS